MNQFAEDFKKQAWVMPIVDGKVMIAVNTGFDKSVIAFGKTLGIELRREEGLFENDHRVATWTLLTDLTEQSAKEFLTKWDKTRSQRPDDSKP